MSIRKKFTFCIFIRITCAYTHVRVHVTYWTDCIVLGNFKSTSTCTCITIFKTFTQI